MGRIIAIANQKGGVGKTTTAINLSAALVEKGKKVLLIDLDPQGNSTSGLGIDKNEQNTIYHLLVEDLDIVTCIRKSVWKALDLIPSTVNLAGAEIEMLDIPRHEFILKTKIHDIENDYDYRLSAEPESFDCECADNSEFGAGPDSVRVLRNGGPDTAHVYDPACAKKAESLPSDGRRSLYDVRCPDEPVSAGCRFGQAVSEGQGLRNDYSAECAACGSAEPRNADFRV